MIKYIAFLRGVNVGGKSLIKMADLCKALSENKLQNLHSYIQSGNIIFESDENDTDKLAVLVSAVIKNNFQVEADVAVFTSEQWRQIISEAPKWWGVDPAWKHNILILIKPYDMQQIMEALGNLKPEIESVQPGKGVIYQSLMFIKFGQTSSSKLVGKPAYKQMTIRNYNTATKLLALLDK